MEVEHSSTNHEDQDLASRLRAAEESAAYWRMRADERHRQIATLEREAYDLRARIEALEKALDVAKALLATRRQADVVEQTIGAGSV